MKILCLTPIKHIQGVWGILESCGTIIYCPYSSASETMSIINKEEPDVLFVNPNQMSFKLDSSILSHCIKTICTASTGLHHIDVEFCQEHHIKVLSLTTDYSVIRNITSTAEMAFALMMSLIRNIPASFDSVKKYNWSYEKFIGRQLDRMSIGIIGHGRLGSMMNKYCRAFGAQVLLCDPAIDMNESYSLEEIVRLVDIISLHVHLKDDTYHMINRPILEKFKPGLYLVNTSRGSIVNENDIIWALENNILFGYATDVLEDELGNISHSKLIEASSDLNIIITPHIGGMTKEAQMIAYQAAANKLYACKDKNHVV